MAVAVPAVYLAASKPVTTRKRADNTDDGQRTWRLAPCHVQDIRDVALGVEESNAGVCCRYLIDHLSSTSSPDVDEEDGYVHRLHEIERFVERYGDFGRIPQIVTWRMRIARCRRAFALLRVRGDAQHANVLMVAYGHDDPFTSMLAGVLGRELANLARYTDAVEMKRIEMVRAETARLASLRTVIAPTRDPGRAWRGVDMRTDKINLETGCRPVYDDEGKIARVEEEDRIQSGNEETRAAIAMGVDASRASADVVSLARRRSQFEWSSRAITSGDAIRHALAPFAEPPVPAGAGKGRLEYEALREARKERQKAHDARREAFLLDAKIDAHRMLVAAEKAYHDAWLKSHASARVVVR